MGNCLKTQLKSVVSNDNLVKLGEISLSVHTTANPTSDTQKLALQIDYTNQEDVTITVDGGAENITTDSTMVSGFVSSDTIRDGNYHTYYLKNGDYKIRIKSKYQIRRLDSGNSIGVDFNDIAFNSSLIGVSSNSQYANGNINAITKNKTLFTAYFAFPNATGTIDSSINLTNLRNLGISGYIDGNIEDLNWQGCNVLDRIELNSLYIEGDIATLLQNIWEGGRRGNVVTTFNTDDKFKCTYNGQNPYQALGTSYIRWTLDNEGIHRN